MFGAAVLSLLIGHPHNGHPDPDYYIDYMSCSVAKNASIVLRALFKDYGVIVLFCNIVLQHGRI